MPFCIKSPDRHRGLLVLAVLLLGGCSSAATDFGFHVERIETRANTEVLEVLVYQKIVLSREARNALDHGVPLSVITEIALRTTDTRRDIGHTRRDFEIRYLPLSNRYQLTTIQPFNVRSYPRLRHVLSELSKVSLVLKVEPLPDTEFNLRVRSFLDRKQMPPPMRLPALFSSQWQHDSGWSTWPLSHTGQQPVSGSGA